MLVEEELAKETFTKATSNYMNNHYNRDEKDNGSTSKKLHALDNYIECTPIGITYTQAVDHLLSKHKIDLLSIGAKTKST